MDKSSKIIIFLSVLIILAIGTGITTHKNNYVFEVIGCDLIIQDYKMVYEGENIFNDIKIKTGFTNNVKEETLNESCEGNKECMYKTICNDLREICGKGNVPLATVKEFCYKYED